MNFQCISTVNFCIFFLNREKENLNETMERLRLDLSAVRSEFDEMREEKQQLVKEVSVVGVGYLVH